MSRLLLALAAVAILSAGVVVMVYLRRPPPPPEPGIPITLAEDRAARVSGLRYDLSLEVPADPKTPITGTMVATFALTAVERGLSFDFQQPASHLQGVSANGRTLESTVVSDHVTIPPGDLLAGENTVEFRFTAGDAPLNRRDDFLYALFVPARASQAIPVFDQPDLKARWRLRLSLPTGWVAVSNGRQSGTLNAPGRVGVIFDETEPISTYLFSFAAGRFSIETAERNGRTYRMFHRETDAAKVARNRDAIFDLHASALGWLESYTAIPYPFGKFDFVAVPSFQFGGMEHPGAVFYNAASLLLDETATQNQLLGRASLIAHETAHMWFGDLVTMQWFNDVWMKEVFANLMAAKIVNPSFPEVNHELRFLLGHYPAAYGVDRTAGANPIRQPLDNLNGAGSLYGAIIYQKAPIVMRQLELLMGADTFREGLREYLKTYAFRNATWPDLVAMLDSRTAVDLEEWSRAWVDEPGRPTIATELVVRDGKVSQLQLRQTDSRDRGLVWPQTLRVDIGWPDGTTSSHPASLTTAVAVIPEALGRPAPLWVLPVGGGIGYGAFTLDPATMAFLSASLERLPDALTRGAAQVALWEAMLDGLVPPPTVVDTLLRALPSETDELNVQDLLGSLRQVFWRWTPADDRPALAPRLEQTLRAGLGRAKSTSVKAAWFNALRGVATTPETVAWLARVWRREEAIPGLPLSESDETSLALDLALREVPDAADLLTSQLGRITNEDRKNRFRFVMPAASADEETRDRFFASLASVENRRREAWVLEGIGLLHHPLRAGSSRRYITPALGLVREIQQTGDIFFPKRWADTTLGGYQSVQTAAEVRALIDGLPPDYPPRLRWVLLSAADELFRVAK